MKTKVLLILLTLTSLTFTQDTQLLFNHKVPTFSYTQGYIQGNDLLNWRSSRYGSQSKTSQLSIGLSGFANYYSQSPALTYYVTGNSALGYGKTTTTQQKATPKENITEISSATVDIKSAINKYFTHERGLFAAGKFDAYYYNYHHNTVPVSSSEIDYSTSLVTLCAGLGYGRIINSGSVARAYMLADELGVHLSDAKIESLSEVLEKYSNGSYLALYKDNSDIEFHKDINAILGIENQNAKVQQILFSGKYKSINRSFGWEAEMGLSNYVLSYNQTGGLLVFSPDGKLKNALYSRAAYAYPIDFNKQFKCDVLFTKSLNTAKSASYVKASTSFEIEHSYKWASAINLVYDAGIPDEGAEWANFSANVSSSYDILSKLSITCTVSYRIQRQNADEFTEYVYLIYQRIPEYESTYLSVDVKYYLF